jgi:7SK snRNA methylphosphate capping enzyme
MEDLPAEVDGAASDPAPPSLQAQAAEQAPARPKRPRAVYRYGNYSGYYGYRVGPTLEDHRLLAFLPEWFAGRRCLDIGCNEGLLTLSLAVKYRPARFVGVDIDGALVRRAVTKLRSLQSASAEAAAEAALLLPGEVQQSDRAAMAAAGHALAGMSFRRACARGQSRMRL